MNLKLLFFRFPRHFQLKIDPFFINPVGSMNINNLDKTLPDLVKSINNIIGIHSNEKGIIHCHTYKICNYLANNLKSKRVLVHNSDNKNLIVNKFLNSNSNHILLSPSSTEGIDLKGDASRFQIICKLAYPYLGDKLVKRRKKNRDKWYEYETVKSLIQSIGRSVRDYDDYAVTYILDGSWDWFYNNNKHLFPPEFNKTIINI